MSLRPGRWTGWSQLLTLSLPLRASRDTLPQLCFRPVSRSQNMTVHNSRIYSMSLLPSQTAGDNKRCLKENPIKCSKDTRAKRNLRRYSSVLPCCHLNSAPSHATAIHSSGCLILQMPTHHQRLSMWHAEILLNAVSVFILKNQPIKKTPRFHGHEIQNVKSISRDTYSLSPPLSKQLKEQSN